MSIAIRPSNSPEDRLHAAICLLGLITARPGNLDELHFEGGEPAVETPSLSGGMEDGIEVLEDDGMGSADYDQKRDLDALRDKVLDRLAETLARYKSNPKGVKGSILDPKHVSSTMMTMYEDENKVKILCSKNEGLAPGNSTDDIDFLNSWKACMERISRAGMATQEDEAYMFDIILKYQQPRISYYVKKLKRAIRFEEPAKHPDLEKRPVLSEVWLRRLPNVGRRTWTDDSGNEFDFTTGSSDEPDNNSKAAPSAGSLRNVDDEVSNIMHLVDKLSSSDTGPSISPRQEALLKDLLPSLFAGWRSARFQASMKAHLHTRFQQSQHPQKRQREVMTALRYLGRCYYAAATFIQAAGTMQNFHNVECIPVPVPPQRFQGATGSKAARVPGTPREVAENLGIVFGCVDWIHYLEKGTTKAAFKKLRGETCHIHAEIQMILYYENFATPEAEHSKVHPYIGCSKLCCLLCWMVIRIHGAFKVRGSHETVLHRWAIPAASPSWPTSSRICSISDDLLRVVSMLLQNTIDQSFHLRHSKLLAQSSAALSTTQAVLDRQKAEMETSDLRRRRMMMMQFVVDDGIMVTENYQKPGSVSVIGGPLTKITEMTCEEAEIFKENHIRLKFGMKKTDEMPPKQSSIEQNTCRRCHVPSNLRCSADRSTAPNAARERTGVGTCSPARPVTGQILSTI